MKAQQAKANLIKLKAEFAAENPAPTENSTISAPSLAGTETASNAHNDRADNPNNLDNPHDAERERCNGQMQEEERERESQLRQDMVEEVRQRLKQHEIQDELELKWSLRHLSSSEGYKHFSQARVRTLIAPPTTSTSSSLVSPANASCTDTEGATEAPQMVASYSPVSPASPVNSMTRRRSVPPAADATGEVLVFSSSTRSAFRVIPGGIGADPMALAVQDREDREGVYSIYI